MLRRADEFDLVASHAIGSLSGFIAMNRIDANRIISQVVPLEPNAPALGHRVGATPEVIDLLDEAESTGSPRATRLVDLFQGGKGVAVYLPVRIDGENAGFINAVIDIEPIMYGARSRLPAGLQIELSEPDGRLPAVARKDRYLYVTRPVAVMNRIWELRVGVPAGATYQTVLATQIAVGIAIFSAILALLYISARERALGEMERRRLRNAIDALPGAFVMLDRKGGLTIANAAALNGRWQFDRSSLVSMAERRWADLAPAVAPLSTDTPFAPSEPAPMPPFRS